MTTDEAARLHLYERAKESWDDDAAHTLMSSLPWDAADLATTRDVGMLKKDLEVLDARLSARIEAAAARTVRHIVFSMVAVNATIAGCVVVGAQLS